jgi:hypothetical protein
VTKKTGVSKKSNVGISKTKVACEQLGKLLYQLVTRCSTEDRLLPNTAALLKKGDYTLNLEMRFARMFGVTMSCEKLICDKRLCEKVLDSFHDEFYEFVRGRGFNEEDLFAFRNLLVQRYEQYSKAMQSEEGSGPFFHLSKAIAANIHEKATFDPIGLMQICAVIGSFMKSVIKTLGEFEVVL